MTKTTTCDICNIRKGVSTLNGMCEPCHTEGEWENEHSDFRHEEATARLGKVLIAGAVELRKLAAGLVKNYGKMKSAELREDLLEALRKELGTNEAEMAGCWICRPELNEAQKAPKAKRQVLNPTVERKSRVGQIVNVPVRAPGIIKAEVVKKKLDRPVVINEMGFGRVSLVFSGVNETLTLIWDEEGRYDYENSKAVTDGQARKVRNVAEALRMFAKQS